MKITIKNVDTPNKQGIELPMDETVNDGMSLCLTQDIKSALVILERIRFEVGPEFMRKDITKAIKLIKSGLSQGEYVLITQNG